MRQHELALAKNKTLQQQAANELALAKQKLELEATQQKADLEFYINLETLKLKMVSEFWALELKHQQEKYTSDKSKQSSSNTDTKGNPHTRIRVPAYRESIDDFEIWLDRWERLYNGKYGQETLGNKDCGKQ